ncbi:pol protein integrase region [Gossypium australe]|uniref:Pol protein integrase region n=1 Tax=Gossypium australe TaxID=47621 RepID=A0A5B6VWZ2_9ROSI|nr:pol protein integrase region [Gossypium australe]
MVCKRDYSAIEVLVEWANTFPEDATWEKLQKLQTRIHLKKGAIDMEQTKVNNRFLLFEL